MRKLQIHPAVWTWALLLLVGMTTPTAYGQTKEGVISSPNYPLASLQAAADNVRGIIPADGLYEVQNFSLKIRPQSQEGVNMLVDPVLQTTGPNFATTVLTSFTGSDNRHNGVNVTPPDTNGDVGPNHYVQMINWVTTVFDKAGNVLGGGPFLSRAFWDGMPNVCGTTNRGDPVVLYDETNDRWLVSQFAFGSNSSTPHECVAISQTGNPLGAYNRYAFDFSAYGLNDYPHLGFTTNAVTIQINLFNPNWAGTYLGAIDKAAMYVGTTATLLGRNLGTSEFGFLSADLDDPSGTAGFIPALYATTASSNLMIDIWQLDPNFSAGTFTLNRIAQIPRATIDSNLCSGACIPHAGSNNVGSLAGRLMHRLQVRDFGSYRTMLMSQTVDAGGGRAGIRWHELRETGGTWSLHQEGTYAPNDGKYRWMPSIAMNAAGDIGLAYMISDASTPIGIAVVGQTAGASGSGNMDATEEICRTGNPGGDWGGRSGDYSATTIDPVTDTFWHTNEYDRSSANRGWGTGVCEWRVSTGTPAPAFTITLLKRFFQPNGKKVAKIKWNPTEVNTGKIDLYVAEAPDGTYLRRTANDGVDKIKLGNAYPGNGPYTIQACEKGSTTVCSNVLSVDWAGAIIDLTEDEGEETEEGGKHAGEEAEATLGNYPDPFNPSTLINFSLPTSGQVSLKVYNMLGQQVASLVSGHRQAGYHEVIFDAQNLSSGVYFYVLQGQDFMLTKRMTLAK